LGSKDDKKQKIENEEKEKTTESKELRKEIKELNKRILELEQVITELREPFKQLQSAAKGYYKFIELFTRYGGISPEVVTPNLKDPISKDILIVLVDRNGINTSQITELVRNRRGSASRRIVREKLANLVEAGYVVKKTSKKSVEYYVSEELIKKWSQVLGLNK
jgi:DNA-binding transcriptional ArsR family regulator